MKRFVSLRAWAAVAALVAVAAGAGRLPAVSATPAALPTPPAPPAVRPVTQQLFGTTVTDRYRYFRGHFGPGRSDFCHLGST